MTEAQADAAPQEGTEQTEQSQDAKTFDAEYVDKLRKEAAKYRTEAKANADAAKRLAQIEESQKSEAEKAADRLKALEGELQDARRESLRFKVASKHGISDEDADLFLTGSDEDTLTKQAERLTARADERKKQGNFVPREGASATSQADGNDAQFARALFAEG